MDTLTHAISGAVVGAATAGRDRAAMPKRALWGAIFAAFPDSDFGLVFFTDYFTYLNEHRGLTHSVVMLPLWAAMLGGLGALFARERWRDMAVLAAAALAAHILGDLITSYGTKVFTPFYDAPLAYPITFIIDPLFTLILFTGLVAALWRRRPAFAAASGAVLACYLLVQAFAQHQATGIGLRYAQSAGQPGAPVVAFPQPFSPFNWKIVVVMPDAYHHAYANLLADEPPGAPGEDAGFIRRVRAAYRPADQLKWNVYPRWPADPEYRAIARAAWTHADFEGFRRFALLPYVTTMHGDSGGLCVWFTDLRFTLAGVQPPFEYAMCRGARGRWQLDMDAQKDRTGG